MTVVAWLLIAIDAALVAWCGFKFFRGLRFEWWQARQPKPPRNVRIVRADGTVVPLELRYTGRRHGIHSWEAVHRTAFVIGEDTVLVDTVPGRTQVTIGLDPR